MSLFVLDTLGDHELLEKEASVGYKKVLGESISISKTKSEKVDSDKDEDKSDEDDDTSDDDMERDYGGLPPPTKDITHIINKHLNSQSNQLHEKGRSHSLKYRKYNSINFKRDIDTKTVEFGQNFNEILAVDLKKELSTSILKSSETLEMCGRSKTKKLKKITREKSKGSDWFNMPATEVTEEIENDLKILQMRSILNPKHFYKKNDLKVLPKYFQIGTVQHSPLEYYNEKHIRRNKKKTMVDELLADAEVKKYAKRKYQEIMAKKQIYNHKKAMKKMKKLKKKK